MALTTVSVYKRYEGSTRPGKEVTTAATEGFETANVLWFGPSICGIENGGTPNASIVSKIILKGTPNTALNNITLYTSSTVAQIAALT